MRSAARDHWRAIHRLARIARRETMKAVNDMLIYGTGAVFVPNDGEPSHVPLEVLLDARAAHEPEWRALWDEINQSGNRIDT